LSAAIFDVLLSLCVPPNLYTGSISMLMIQIVQKVHFWFVVLAWKVSDLLWPLKICKVELSNCCYPAVKTSMLQLCWIVDATAGLHNQTARCQTS
jgi:hypothetical protein